MADEKYLVCNADSKHDDLRDVTCIRCKYWNRHGTWPSEHRIEQLIKAV